MRMNHNHGICTGWWMHRSGQKHEYKRQHDCEKIDPRRVTQGLEAHNSDDCPTKMTSEKGSRLHGGCASKAEQEHYRSAEGSDQQWCGGWVNEPQNSSERRRRADRARGQAQRCPQKR
jgi:hypothetical protein